MNALVKPCPAALGERLLVPGRNCWRIERAARWSTLIDASSYYAALRKAMIQARRSIVILAWDVDSRTKLVPAGAHDGWPEPLGEFLSALVRRHRELRVNVLSWDFAMLFALEREWLPVFRNDLKTRRRLEFKLDDAHPIAASHHQKIVVIDDAVAFVGGLDLTRCRWDTPRHGADEPLRCDASGKPYAPFHDVQVMVDGAAARALGELARERWFRATGKRLTVPEPPRTRDRWPDGVEPDLVDVDVAISRTEPEYDGRAGVGEIRQLLLDAIGAARRSIFIEQQYFTSLAIGDALSARLGSRDTPEIVAVLCRKQYGWLEQRSMGVLRARLDAKLRAADKTGRYRAYAPRLARGEEEPLNVHSKVIIVDDELLTIGSANLSNRSMGFDTECNLAIEARGDPRIAEAIARVRERLLAEHLDVSPDDVRRECTRRESLIASIEVLRGRDRTLTEFEPHVEPEVDAVVPEGDVLDPERPIAADRLVDALLPPPVQWSVRRRVLSGAAAAIALLAVIGTWHFGGVRAVLDADRALALVAALRDWPWSPAVLGGAFLVGAVLPFPVLLWTLFAAWVLGPVRAAALALSCATAAAALGWLVGRALGRDGLRRFGGRRINGLARRLSCGGFGHVLLLRVLPAGAFNTTSWVAGAARLRFASYIAATALGLVPGIAATTLLLARARAALLEPTTLNIALLAAIVAAIAGVGAFIARRVVRPRAAALVEGTVA